MNTLNQINETKVAHIAHSFLTDAYFFLEKVLVFRSHDPNKRTSLIAKLAVDLLMSSECSLKAAYASSQSAPAEELMVKIKREFKHDIRKTLSYIDDSPLEIEEKDFLEKMSDEGVGLRYSLD